MQLSIMEKTLIICNSKLLFHHYLFFPVSHPYHFFLLLFNHPACLTNLWSCVRFKCQWKLYHRIPLDRWIPKCFGLDQTILGLSVVTDDVSVLMSHLQLDVLSDNISYWTAPHPHMHNFNVDTVQFYPFRTSLALMRLIADVTLGFAPTLRYRCLLKHELPLYKAF